MYVKSVGSRVHDSTQFVELIISVWAGNNDGNKITACPKSSQQIHFGWNQGQGATMFCGGNRRNHFSVFQAFPLWPTFGVLFCSGKVVAVDRSAVGNTAGGDPEI